MSEAIATQRAPRRSRSKPMRVICEQNITPEWAQALIKQVMPALVELYRKALESKRAEAEQVQREKINESAQRERA